MASRDPSRGRRPDRSGRGPTRREYFWQIHSLWLVPMMCILGGALVAAITLSVDHAVGYDALPSSVLGTPTAVQTILSTAASSMLTLTTIVLTVLTLGVQLAMQQFSPRIVRALLGDRASQFSHGLFAATFLFCMIAVAQVDDTAEPGHQVPSVTVALGYVLLFASLIVLVGYVHHAGQSLRVAGLIDVVGDSLQSEIDRSFPAQGAVPAEDDVVPAAESGVVVMLDHRRLVEEARRSDVRLEMLAAVGDFVPRGAPLVRRTGDGPVDTRAVRRAVVLDNERSHVGDAAYGLRKLVDIAERSIASSPHQDPATAVQSIDRLHDAMRQLCVRPLSESLHRDAEGTVRLVTRELSWPGYVAVAFDELVDVGSSSPLVARRLLAALDDLLATAPAERRGALRERRDLLVDASDDKIIALAPDVQGLGSGPDLLA